MHGYGAYEYLYFIHLLSETPCQKSAYTSVKYLSVLWKLMQGGMHLCDGYKWSVSEITYCKKAFWK